MKKRKFNNHKVGYRHEIKLQNIVVIFLSILIGLGSIVVFANVDIQTNLNNSLQIISRIIISTDGTDNENKKLYDLNYDGSGGIKIYKTNIAGIEKNLERTKNNTRDVLGTDGNGKIIILPSNAFSGGSNGNTNGNGTSGPTGAIGPMGPAGTNGINGINGTNGATGAMGPTGYLQVGIPGATPFWSGNEWITNNINIFNKGSFVGIGYQPGATLYAQLDVNGIIKISNSTPSIACDNNIKGSIRFRNNCFQGCDGTSWVDLGGAGCTNTNSTFSCQGFLPANSIPTSIGILTTNIGRSYATTPGLCTFVCNTNYTRNGSSCTAATQTTACGGEPQNAVRNTATQINQTRNGTSRTPSNIGTYSTTPSTTECKFKCNAGYIRSGGVCEMIAIQPTYSCSGTLINGAIANNIIPVIANTGRSYSTTPGNCTYTCNVGYIRSGNTCQLNSLPPTYSCSGILTTGTIANNTIPVTANTGRSYSTTPGNCTYTCNVGYTRNNSTQICEVTPVTTSICGRGRSSRGGVCSRGQ